jgi:hypothetical protein
LDAFRPTRVVQDDPSFGLNVRQPRVKITEDTAPTVVAIDEKQPNPLGERLS